jgi:hypothetical protein
MSEGKDLRLQRCSSLKSLPSRRNQRENDGEHVAEKLQRRLPKFNQFSQNGVFGRDSGRVSSAVGRLASSLRPSCLIIEDEPLANEQSTVRADLCAGNAAVQSSVRIFPIFSVYALLSRSSDPPLVLVTRSVSCRRSFGERHPSSTDEHSRRVALYLSRISRGGNAWLLLPGNSKASETLQNYACSSISGCARNSSTIPTTVNIRNAAS